MVKFVKDSFVSGGSSSNDVTHLREWANGRTAFLNLTISQRI